MFFLLLLARGDPLNVLVLRCQIDPNFLRIHLASSCAFFYHHSEYVQIMKIFHHCLDGFSLSSFLSRDA